MYTTRRTLIERRCRTTGWRIFVASRGAGARPNGIAVHWYFLSCHMKRKYLRSSGLIGRWKK